MRYVAAYLLAALGGKASPQSADIEKILSSVGIEADAEKLKKVISELNGKSIDELIASGTFTNSYCKRMLMNSFCRSREIVFYACRWSCRYDCSCSSSNARR